MADRAYKTFAEFWPYYLQEHSHPTTRALHYVGTALAIACAVVAAVTLDPVWLIGMPLSGYFFAWLSHATVERNKPATFTYPLWSLVSDFRMFFLWLGGRLDAELKRAGVAA